MKTTVWYLLVICLIKVKEMVNYIFAEFPLSNLLLLSLSLISGSHSSTRNRPSITYIYNGIPFLQLVVINPTKLAADTVFSKVLSSATGNSIYLLPKFKFCLNLKPFCNFLLYLWGAIWTGSIIGMRTLL